MICPLCGSTNVIAVEVDRDNDVVIISCISCEEFSEIDIDEVEPHELPKDD